MNEQEGRKVFSHAIAMCKVFGGDIREMCAQRGVPDDLITKLLAEQNFWDKGLGKFDWDGSVRLVPTERSSGEISDRKIERRQEERVSVSIPATFTLENKLFACMVLNMSTGGLLLKFVQQPDLLLSIDDAGKNGTVVLGIGEKTQKSLQGKIVRVLLNDHAREAALSVIG